MSYPTPPPVTGGPRQLPLPLGTGGSVVLDGSGNGVASCGPTRVREHWQPVGAAVKVSTNVKESTCSVYVGPQVADPYFVSTTITGSTGDTCGLGIDIESGQQIWAVWKGGDPGATATMAVTGTYSYGTPPGML